jgi:tetratricopeptide (TPR) repeat protein
MPQNLLKVLMPLGVAVTLWACAPHQKTVPAATIPPEVAAKDVGAYYYYTRSRLMKKQGEINRAIELLGEAVARDKDSIFLKSELVKLYLQHKDYKQALTLTEEIIAKDPKHIPSNIMAGDIYGFLNRHTEAIEAYEKALALDPKSERIHILLGSQYVKNKEPDKAVELYQALTRINPESFAGHFHMGTVSVTLKRYDQAEAAFLKCLELRPHYEPPLFELVSIYETTGKHEKVVDTYKKLLDNDPDNIKAAVGLGHYYLKMSRAGEAERVFERLKLRSRSNPLVVKQIALIYLDQKKYQEAAEALQILLEDNGDQPEIHYFLGMAFEGLKKTDEAIATYMKVKDGSPYYRSAVVHLSFLYQEKGDQQRAVDLMSEALKKEPNEPELYLFLGALYEEMEAYDKAVDTLKKGLDFQPDHIRLHFRLGVVYDKSGDKEACIHEMKSVVDTDPTHAEALNYLGYTYAELGTNLDEAEDLIKMAMEHKPNDGFITDSLGWVYYKKGLFKEAIKFLEEAAKLVSDDPTILEHLADAYIKMNDAKRALKYYKKALEYIEEDNDKGSIKGKIESLEKKLSQDT